MKQFVLICFCHLITQFVLGQQSPVVLTEGGREVPDTAFWQEYHQGFIVGNDDGDNDVRSVAVDEFSNVWIASASGIFIKDKNKGTWSRVLDEESRGPAYAVIADKEGVFGWGHGMVYINFKITNLEK